MKIPNNIFCKFYCQANVFLIICLSVISLASNAAELESESSSGFTASSGIDFSSYIQVFVALIAVLIIIFILSMLLKKFHILQGQGQGLIRVIAGISISNKDRLLLIQVGEEQILISASLGRINKIHQLTTLVESSVDLSSASSKGKNSFNNILHSTNSRQGE